MVPAVMKAQVAQIIAQCGLTVRHRRYAGGVYDDSKTYQGPTATPALDVDADIAVAWNLATMNHIVNYFGRLEPDELTVVTTSDVRAGDVILKDFGLSTQKVYHVQQARPFIYLNTLIAVQALVKEMPGRTG